MSSQAVTVFVSYSHKDENLRDELAKHLRTLQRSGLITAWHDRQILPGDEWDKQIKGQLNTAQIILLLVSPDFIDSDYCYNVEITRAMERHECGEARVIPVILRRCLWHVTPFGKLQALPRNGTPVMDVSTWPTRDDAFYSIAEGIQKAAQSFAKAVAEDNAQVVSQPSIQTVAVSVEEATPIEDEVVESTPIQEVFAPAVPVVKARTLLDQDPFQNAQAQYRARVKEYLVGRELTVFHEARLDYLREQLKLPEPEAQRILSEELVPIEHARGEYRETLSRLIEAGQDPTEAGMQQELTKFKQSLGLTEREIKEIEQPFLAVLAKKEIEGSECGIDYGKLRDLLKASEWEAADRETYEVMIRAVGRESGDYFRVEELMNFSCGDLRIIDRLWVKYSNGRFGFSVQKQIYVKCGAKLDGKYPGDKIYEAFGYRIGWRRNDIWVRYSNLTFKRHSAPLGHLPVVWRDGMGRWTGCLFSRLETGNT